MSIYHDYYVYAFLREDLTPYYIGKGRQGRAYSKQRSSIKPPIDKTKIRIFMKNMTEDLAFFWEKYWIKCFGRIENDNGCLRNLTDGGEGTSGYKHTKETKKKMSENSNRDAISAYNRGRILSEEHKRNISEVRKMKNLGKQSAKYLKPLFGDLNPMRNPEYVENFKKRITGRKRKYREDGTWFWYKEM